MRCLPVALSVVALSVGQFGCGERHSKPPAQPLAALALPQPGSGLRLPKSVAPVAYALQLRMSPSEERFTGQVRITVSITQATSVVWLHAGENLVIQSALAGTVPARVERNAAAEAMIALTFAQPLPVGTHELNLAYEGKLPSNDDNGAYRQIEPDASYIFTQFEATDARRAFPCFDEPGFKTPFTLSLDVPSANLAFANTPQVSETAIEPGWKRIAFAPSKPLPTYLVAFAVGPFEVVDGGKAGSKQTPVRIIVPKGKSKEASYAAATTAKVVERLEAYFGIPYPYEKLDHIAVPQKGGAMENPGLITYGTSTILGKPDEKSVRLERGYLSIAAHELGHIWFGDYVTAAWWDDIWLNEAFATWIAAKIVDEMHPEWDGAVSRVRSKDDAMETDSLVNTRRIRQPIASKHDIANAFDSITYQKGGAVITMFESFVGPKPFQAGVHAYLERHAHGNATATDFLQDVGDVSGRKDEFASAFATFLDQPGLPLVTATLSCDGAPKVALSQVRYLPQGSTGVPAQSWKIPVCVSYPGGKSCTLMTEATAVLPLADTKVCPAWVNANANADGYYRVAYKGELSSRVLQATGPAQTVHERVGTLGDVLALVRSGAMQEGDALERVPTLVREGNRHLVGMTTGLIQSLSEPTDLGVLKPNYERFVAKTFGPRARELGWKPKGGEDDGTRLLRPNVLALVTRDERNPLVKEARALTEAWIVNRKAIEPDLVSVVLETAARAGDRALWDKLHAAAKTATERKERSILLSGMANFRDVAIVRDNFAIALSDEFDARESLKLVSGASQNPETRQAAYDFVKANFDKLVARLPNEWGASLPSFGEGFCDSAHRADLAAFFKDRVASFNGGPRELAQTLETIDLCTAQNPARQASIAAFLKKY